MWHLAHRTHGISQLSTSRLRTTELPQTMGDRQPNPEQHNQNGVLCADRVKVRGEVAFCQELLPSPAVYEALAVSPSGMVVPVAAHGDADIPGAGAYLDHGARRGHFVGDAYFPSPGIGDYAAGLGQPVFHGDTAEFRNRSEAGGRPGPMRSLRFDEDEDREKALRSQGRQLRQVRQAQRPMELEGRQVGDVRLSRVVAVFLALAASIFGGHAHRGARLDHRSFKNGISERHNRRRPCAQRCRRWDSLRQADSARRC